MGKGPSRRRLLIGGAALTLSYPLAGCDLFSTEPSQQGRSGRGKGRGDGKAAADREAPSLAALVKKGKLPPVGERLPEQPLVVDVADRSGVYGGRWNTAYQGSGDTAWLVRTVGYDYLTRWTPDWKKLIPNLVLSYDINPEGSEVTLQLRKGLKWSDGKPFTADDLIFAQNDVLGEEALYPVPRWPGKAVKDGDYTVRFEFDKPQGLFVQEQAMPDGTNLLLPRHYLETFHKKFNPDIDSVVEESGAGDWTKLFLNKADRWANPDLPTLNPWMAKTPLGKGTQMVFERNPFYWKTDRDGRQLPYLDSVVFVLTTDVQVMLTKALNGDLDCHVRHFNNLANKPVLARGRSRGDYEFFDADPAYMNTVIIGLNLNHKNEALRTVFSNREFRIGLSYAINRQEIIDAVYQRQGEPWQAAPRKGSGFYTERLAKQYTDYDVDRANQHLDRAGYRDRDGQGVRIGPDGKGIFFTVETYVSETPGLVSPVDTLELVRGYWKKVGVDMRVKTEDRSLYGTRTEAGSHDAAVITSDGGANADVYRSPYSYLPMGSWSQVFAPQWTLWYTSKGASGEAPPPVTKKQLALYDRLKATPSRDGEARLMRKILDITAEQFYVIGISSYPESYGIVKNDFHNVPKTMPLSYTYPTPAPTNPEQYFKGAG